MVKVSLTSFVDFVSSSGTPKLTLVKRIKAIEEYHPKYDFWKILRDNITEFHRSGQTDKKYLDRVIGQTNAKNKLARYPDCIAGYKRFLGRKEISWFEPPRALKEIAGLQIIVNPELGLVINGAPHIIKLYFKQDKLAELRISIIQLLLKISLEIKPGKKPFFSLLDIPRSKLYFEKDPDVSLLPLLAGEAANFRTIWENL